MTEQKLAPEGNNPCTVLDGAYGVNDKGIPVVRVNVRMKAGPTAGKIYTYEEEVTNKGMPYIVPSLQAIGWKGVLANTAADVAAWVEKTGGDTTVEIVHHVIKKGKREGQIWDKPRNLGRGPKPLKQAAGDAAADAQAFADAFLREQGGPPADDVPHASERDPDDLPFARAHGSEPTAIARVLRGAL